MKANFMTIQFMNNRNNMSILMNMNTCNSNTFDLLFYSIFGAQFFIPKLDCTYHTSDHVASCGNISLHLNLIKVPI